MKSLPSLNLLLIFLITPVTNPDANLRKSNAFDIGSSMGRKV